MRLRITIKRHGLPETPIIWNVEFEKSTIVKLLEKVNDIIPIESNDWGLEDYAVELKGSNGINFECLHFQEVGQVMKEDDEVIIRPLLAEDLKIRKISGRHQISADGKHLVDGLAFGRQLLRRPGDRPAVNIPPRKRQRFTYNEDEDDDEGFLALKEREEAEGGDSDDENGNRQLVLHADFEDDDSEDDEDFVPEEDEELDEDVDEAEAEEDETMENEAEKQECQMESATKFHNREDEDDEYALDVPDEATRTKIRKLHSAFPASPLAVCKYVLNGSGGDVGEAYGTMSLGFRPAKPASAITESSKADLSVPKTRSKKREAPTEEVEVPDSLQVEAAETADSLLLEHYDQNGLPPGSISLGKALTYMAEAVQSSPARSRPTSRKSNSAFSNKSVRFSMDEGLANRFTSTPAIDHESLADDSEEESEDSSSDVTSSSGSSSSDEDSSSSDESEEDAEVSDTSSSGSDSGSSSDSSSDDDAPEETSTKTTKPSPSNPATLSANASPPKAVSRAPVPPGSGKHSTTARNARRRGANALNRFIEKGILPAGTTVAELKQLLQVDSDTSPEDATTALEALRADKQSAEINEKPHQAIAQSKEFEARRQALFDSLASGGIEVGLKSSKKASKASSAQIVKVGVDATPSQVVSVNGDQQESQIEFSTAPQTHQTASAPIASQGEVATQPSPRRKRDPPTTSTNLENILKLPVQREIKLRLNKKFSNPDRLSNKEAAAAYQRGEVQEEECLDCQARKGPFEACVRLDNFFGGACCNCKVNDEYTRCDFFTYDTTPKTSRRRAALSPQSGRQSQPKPQSESQTEPQSPSQSQSQQESQSINSESRLSLQISGPGIVSTTVAPPASIPPEPTIPKDADSDAISNVSAAKAKPPPPATESAQSSAASPRRAKLDLGAGRRMLFGALGLKAPKSKTDEEKLRSDLMKDVRPVSSQKAAGKAAENDDEEEIEDQDSEAWREKITYRAVECCHDGVELTEPPFPFVQRWDPQQQGSWPQKGKNGSKRKKNQRDEPQYYQDEGRPSKKQKQRKGKHSYAKQQEYLDASHEPSYQEDSIMESEGLIQETRLPTDDIECEINQQLMNDLNEGASAHVSQGPEDLAPLPHDPNILIDLQDGQVKAGMTIAFKELTMSEVTNWQPEISAYRTAVVNAILDNGEFQLTLALRDRLNSEKFYDAETGERVYGKFDMPDQDEEDEEQDDGIRNLIFPQLVEPKIVQGAPADLGADNSQSDEQALPKLGTDCEPQILSHENDGQVEEAVADAQFSHVTEAPLNLDAPESNLQDSNQESVPGSPGTNAQLESQELDRYSPGPNAQRSNPEVNAFEEAPKQMVDESQTEVTVISEDQETSIPTIDKGKAIEVIKDNAGDEVTAREQSNTPVFDPDTSIGQISTDARLKISQMMKDAGFRSNVPSSVMKDIRLTGMESPGDANVFEKLMKDMTEIEGNPPYSPKFHGLNSSSPIKKLRQVSTDREPSSSPVRVQSSWHTIDTDAASSPPLNDEEGSSWLTVPEEPSSPPVQAPSKHAAKKPKPAKKFKVPHIGRAQEIWEALQPKSRRPSVSSKSSRASPGPSTGIDGTVEKENDTTVQYPKLSVASSFTSQISDHGRQPDLNFDDSAMTSGDSPKATVFEDGSFINQPGDSMTDVEQELPSHKQASSGSPKEDLGDPFLDEQQPPRKSKTNGSAKSRSKTPEVLQGSPSSDDAFPTFEEVLSQRDTTREKTTPVRSKPARQIKAENIQKKACDEDFDLSQDEQTTPKASQRNPRSSNPQHSLPSTSQLRKSPRHSQVRGSQPSASQSRPSQSQSKFVIPQGSQVMDLTMTSSDVDEEANDTVVSEAEQPPKRLRKYALAEDDDDDYIGDEPGWMQKKSSSQKGAGTRRQLSTGLKASSQSSLNTSRRKTTARL